MRGRELWVPYVIAQFRFFSIYHFFHDAVLGIEVAEEFFVIAGVVGIRNYIDVKLKFCFSLRKHVAEDADAVDYFTYVFDAVVGGFELPHAVFGDDDVLLFIEDDAAAGGLHLGDDKRGVSGVGHREHDVELLTLFDGVVMPDGVFDGHGGGAHFLSASGEVEGKYGQQKDIKYKFAHSC